MLNVVHFMARTVRRKAVKPPVIDNVGIILLAAIVLITEAYFWDFFYVCFARPFSINVKNYSWIDRATSFFMGDLKSWWTAGITSL